MSATITPQLFWM